MDFYTISFQRRLLLAIRNNAGSRQIFEKVTNFFVHVLAVYKCTCKLMTIKGSVGADFVTAENELLPSFQSLCCRRKR